VELHGAQGDRGHEVFQVRNDDAAVAQRRLKDKQLEEKTNTDCLVKEQEKGNVAEKKKVKESMEANLGKLLKYNAWSTSDVNEDKEASDSENKNSDEDKNLNVNQNDDEEEEHPDSFKFNDDEEEKDELYKSFEQVIDDAHVTLTTTQKTEGSMQSSSVSSNFASKFLNLDNVPLADNEVASMMNVKVCQEESSTLAPPFSHCACNSYPGNLYRSYNDF
ncbi:hypothetical protein Tco_1429990, partial [Tanacetum coccineum]